MKRSFVILAFTLSLTSCKKDDANPAAPSVQQEKVTDYFPLAIGNYWVYEVEEILPSYSFFRDDPDSLYIEKDTLCNGNLYWKLVSSQWGESLMRDSAGYLIDEYGKKLFTVHPDTATLSDTTYDNSENKYRFITKMMTSDSVCSVPAGVFQAKYIIGTLTATKSSPTALPERKAYKAYVKNIGRVYNKALYVFGGGSIEERLVRYRLNN